MAAVHKKHEEPKKEEVKQSASAESYSEPKPVVISDTVTETTERIEVIKEVSPEPSKTAPAVETASPDPLTDFKEKMNEEEEQSVSSAPPQKNFMWPILFVVSLALVSLIGVFLYKQGMNKGTQVNVVTLSPTPTVMPKPSKAIDFSKYSIKILNGSEIDGEAGRQKTNLEGEGFTISSVGNAANSDYTKTIIQAKEAVESAYLNKLKSVLEESFVVGEMEELPRDADSDIIVIIGSKTN